MDPTNLGRSRRTHAGVLNCWVTETKLTPWLSNCSRILAKSASPVDKRPATFLGEKTMSLLGLPAFFHRPMIQGIDQSLKLGIQLVGLGEEFELLAETKI